MNSKKFSEIMTETIEMCLRTLEAKSGEYATADRLHNFKVAAKLQHCSPMTALAGMMAKHTVSVYDLIQVQEEGLIVSRKMWDEKIGDHINYLLLLMALVREKEDEDIKERG